MTESLSNQDRVVIADHRLDATAKPAAATSSNVSTTEVSNWIQGRSLSAPSSSMANQVSRIDQVRSQGFAPQTAGHRLYAVAGLSQGSSSQMMRMDQSEGSAQGIQIQEASFAGHDHTVSLLREDQSNLSQIASTINDVVDLEKDEKSEAVPFQMTNVANTQNPVAKIGMPFLVPLDKIPSASDSAPKPNDYRAVILKSVNKHQAAFKDPAEKSKECNNVFVNVVGKAFQSEQRPERKISRVLQALQVYRQDKIAGNADVGYLDDIIASISEMLAVDMEGVQSHYQKQEVIAKLEEKLEGSNGDQSLEINKALTAISSKLGESLSEPELDKILKGDLAKVKSGLKEFALSTEVIHNNGGRKSVSEELRKAADLKPTDVVSYAFKTGTEGHRELLAGKVASQLGLSKFLVKKYETTFENAKLGDQQNPTGIASRWLEGTSDISTKELGDYLQLEMKCEQAELRGEDTSQLRYKMEVFKERMIEGYTKPELTQERRQEVQSSYRAKLNRAFQTQKRIYGGGSEGAKPMDSVYHPELIDAQHAYGRDIHPFWQIWSSNDGITISFSEWMEKIRTGENVEGMDQLREKGLVGSESTPLRHVTYLDETQRPAYELKIDQQTGEFSTGSQGILNTTQESKHPHIFVVNPDNKVYVGSYSIGEFNHSSLLAGGSVQSAGELIFKEGRLEQITDKSGHYKPSQEMVLNGLEALKNKGVDLSQVELSIGMQENKKIFNALKYLENPPSIESKPTTSKAPSVQKSKPAESSQPLDKESLQHQVLLDELFCSYDSHVYQYKVEDGKVFNFDFARFLAPHEAFVRGENVFVSLRSTLLDNPVTTVPISPQLISQIKGWDSDKIEAGLKSQGLVGDEETFRKAEERIQNPNESTEEVQEEVFKQIHPKAMKRFKERMVALQEYITDCEQTGTESTLRGAFDNMYPDLAPFIKVARRMYFNPSAQIGIKDGKQQPLQSIIDDAKTKDLATPEEIEAMEKALENLRQQGCSVYEARTAFMA